LSFSFEQQIKLLASMSSSWTISIMANVTMSGELHEVNSLFYQCTP